MVSYFLQPNKLGPKGRGNARFLFLPEFIIDLDSKSGCLDDDVKADTLEVIKYMRDYFSVEPRAIVYSGQKGFHLHYPFPFPGFRQLSTEEETIRFAKAIVKTIEDATGVLTIDDPVSTDTRRLIRIPGSVHGRTGNLVEKIKEKDIMSYEPKHVVDVSNYIRKHGVASDLEKEALGYTL